MRLMLGLFLVGLTAGSFAQTKMRVIFDGKEAGTASLTQRLREDGSKQVLLSIELATGGSKVIVRSESIYSANGMPVRKFQETIAEAQKFRRSHIVTFDAKGANVVEDLNGQRKTMKVALDPKAPRAVLSEFWFLREKPKVGAESNYYTFNLESLTWVLTTSKYVGVVDATIGGKKVKAHKVSTDRGLVFMAMDGSPLRLELPNGALERVW